MSSIASSSDERGRHSSSAWSDIAAHLPEPSPGRERSHLLQQRLLGPEDPRAAPSRRLGGASAADCLAAAGLPPLDPRRHAPAPGSAVARLRAKRAAYGSSPPRAAAAAGRPREREKAKGIGKGGSRMKKEDIKVTKASRPSNTELQADDDDRKSHQAARGKSAEHSKAKGIHLVKEERRQNQPSVVANLLAGKAEEGPAPADTNQGSFDIYDDEPATGNFPTIPFHTWMEISSAIPGNTVLLSNRASTTIHESSAPQSSTTTTPVSRQQSPTPPPPLSSSSSNSMPADPVGDMFSTNVDGGRNRQQRRLDSGEDPLGGLLNPGGLLYNDPSNNNSTAPAANNSHYSSSFFDVDFGQAHSPEPLKPGGSTGENHMDEYDAQFLGALAGFGEFGPGPLDDMMVAAPSPQAEISLVGGQGGKDSNQEEWRDQTIPSGGSHHTSETDRITAVPDIHAHEYVGSGGNREATDEVLYADSLFSGGDFMSSFQLHRPPSPTSLLNTSLGRHGSRLATYVSPSKLDGQVHDESNGIVEEDNKTHSEEDGSRLLPTSLFY